MSNPGNQKFGLLETLILLRMVYLECLEIDPKKLGTMGFNHGTLGFNFTSYNANWIEYVYVHVIQCSQQCPYKTALKYS